LTAGVLLAHLLLADRVLEQRLGWGNGDKPPPRIDVAFVRELTAAAPPAVGAPPPPRPVAARLPAVASKPRQAASAPAEPADSADLVAAKPAEPDPTLAAVAPPAASPSSAPADAAPALPATADLPAAAAQRVPDPLPAAAPPAASAASTARFDWPPSTRLTYQLSGHYRGPVDGSAQVEWLREGSRYQVRMSTAIGPVLSRSIASEGELTEAGLAPRRFDGEQKVLFRAARRWSLRFGPERITLPDGRELATQPGVQDEASQFVQLTWLFTTRPERLTLGQAIDIPLIVNRTVERWIYDVVAEETLNFAFGAVPTVHVKPRREASGSDLTAEIWFAPTLQYLPVRILIRQPPDSWIDLTLDKPPLQAADPVSPR
jgi:uncharacterized protein YbdZ (MbtH family)